MKRLFSIAVVFLACGSVHANQWYYVDFGSAPIGGSQECVTVPGGMDPVSALKAASGTVDVTVTLDKTFADGSRRMNVTRNGKAFEFASTAAMCHEMRAKVHRLAVAYLAGQNKWYVDQSRGDCVELADSFSGMNTPDQLHKVMTSHGAHLSLERRGDDVALITDDSRRFPPLVMVRGLAQCQQSDPALIASQ